MTTVRRDLVRHLALFAGELRERGVPVRLSDEADAAEALVLVDLLDQTEVCHTLRTALKIRRRHWEVFDSLFRTHWVGASTPEPRKKRKTRAAPDRTPNAGRSGAAPRLGAAAAAEVPDPPEGDSPGYSPYAVLRRKSFDDCSVLDLEAMEEVLARLTLRLATRRSRRHVPTKGRGRVDLRRSFRLALGNDGELFSLAKKRRPIEEPRLVLLCDTSGSMDPHTRFLLTFVLSLRRVARRAEVFSFNTELTRLTPWLSARKIASTLDRLASGVRDWSGGTKIGACLAEFVERYQTSVVDSRTMVVILSDGLDRGDPAVLAAAMREIHNKARKVIWLNPLMGDPRYEPTARGMAAALPFVDHFATAHNLASLESLVPLLAA